MTREEAIAFLIYVVELAIKALEQEQKSEWEHDQEILKAHSEGAREMLDIIRAEIEKERDAFGKWDESDRWYAYDECLDIIDRYIGENEEETNKKILTAMKESADAVKNSPKYDFSCVTSLFDKEKE